MVFAVHLMFIGLMFVELTPEPVPPKKVLQGMLVTRSQPVVFEQLNIEQPNIEQPNAVNKPPPAIENEMPPVKEQAPVKPITQPLESSQVDNVQVEAQRPAPTLVNKNDTPIKPDAKLSQPNPEQKLLEKIKPADKPIEKTIAPIAPKQSTKPTETPTPTPQPAKAVVEAEQDIVPPRVDATLGQNPAPPYPRISRRLKEEGTVLLEIYILANGQVGEMRIKQSSGFNRLDQAARAAVAKWRYQPATKNGQSIGFWYVQPIYFSLTDT